MRFPTEENVSTATVSRVFERSISLSSWRGKSRVRNWRGAAAASACVTIMDFTGDSRKGLEKRRNSISGIFGAELYERVSAAGRPIPPPREEPRQGPESIPASRTTRVLFMRVRSYTRRSNKPVAHEVNQCTRPVGTTRRRRERIDFGARLKLLDPETERNQFPLAAKATREQAQFCNEIRKDLRRGASQRSDNPQHRGLEKNVDRKIVTHDLRVDKFKCLRKLRTYS